MNELKMSSTELSIIEVNKDLNNEIQPKELLTNNDFTSSAADITEIAINMQENDNNIKKDNDDEDCIHNELKTTEKQAYKDLISEIESKESLCIEESDVSTNMTENTSNTCANLTDMSSNINTKENNDKSIYNNNGSLGSDHHFPGYKDEEDGQEPNVCNNNNKEQDKSLNTESSSNKDDKQDESSKRDDNQQEHKVGSADAADKQAVEIKCDVDCDVMLYDIKDEIIDDDYNVPANFMELVEHFLTKEARVVLQRIVVYECPECPRVFTSSGQRSLHKAKHVANQVLSERKQPEITDARFIKRIECPECDMLFVQETTLEAHMVIHRPYPHICDCGIGYFKPNDLEQHEKIVHNRIKIEPNYTSTWKPNIKLKKTKRSDINRKRLPKQPEVKEPTPEPTISRYGRTQKRFVIVKEQSPNLEYSSDDLDDDTMFQQKKRAKYKPKTLEQIEQQQNRQIKKESKAQRKAQNKEKRVAIKNENSKKGPFICSICDRELKSYHIYKTHLLSHSNLKNYKCKVCEKGFNTSTGLRNHEQIHSEKQYKCSFCGKTFNHKHNLATHENIHMKLKQYICGYCKKSFTDQSAMKRHERIHTGEKPYKCQYCPKAFSDASAAIAHKRRHVGKRNYACNFCNKTFIDKHGRDLHEKLHVNDFAYECDLCSAKFKLKQYLVTHMKGVHSKRRKVKCSMCDRKLYKVNMAKHMLDVHDIKIKNKKMDDFCAESIEIKIDVKKEVSDLLPETVE